MSWATGGHAVFRVRLRAVFASKGGANCSPAPNDLTVFVTGVEKGEEGMLANECWDKAPGERGDSCSSSGGHSFFNLVEVRRPALFGVDGGRPFSKGATKDILGPAD
jgi:hypothetical protein